MRSAMMVVGLVTAAAACRPTTEFACQSHADCVGDVEGGICEANGYCSFGDPTCDSNRRYGQYAPSHIANSCVELQELTPSSPSSGAADTGRPTSDATTTDAVDADSGGSVTTSGPGGSSGADATEDGAETGSADGPVETSESESADSGDPDACDGFTDDFEGDAIDPAWLRFPNARVEQAQGELRFDVSAEVDVYVSAQIDQGFDLSHGRIRTKLAESTDAQFLQQILVIRDADDVEGGTSALLVVEHDVLWARLQPDEAPLINLGQLPFDPVEHVWLQMRGDEGMLVFEVGNAELDFEPLGQVEAPFPLVRARPELVAGNWNMLEQDEQLSFDDFEVCVNNP